MPDTSNDIETYVPTYVTVKRAIAEMIQRGALKSGARISSESELKRRFKCSDGPVRKALSDLVNEGMVYRVQGKGTFVSSPISLKKSPLSKAKTIGAVLCHAEADSPSTLILRGAEKCASSHKYSLIYRNSMDKPQLELAHLRHLKEEGTKGVMIFPADWYEPANVEFLAQLKDEGFPFVLVDRYSRELDTDYAVTDNVSGVYEAVTHLIKLNHGCIAYITLSDPATCTATQDKLAGYKKALLDNGIDLSPEKNGYVNVSLGKKSPAQMVQECLELNPKPTAIFADTGKCAVGVFKSIRALGLRVPDDMALVGYDDNTWVTEHMEVPATMVAQPHEEVGKRASEILMDKIERGTRETHHLLLKPRLIIRESCGAKKVNKVTV